MDLKFDSVTNDLVIENGEVAFVTGPELTAQLLRDRFQTNEGEKPADLEYGSPWRRLVFNGNKGVNRLAIASAFRRLILETNGVLRIVEFDLSLNLQTRSLSIEFEVEVEGDAVVGATVQIDPWAVLFVSELKLLGGIK